MTGCAPGRPANEAGLPYISDAHLSARLTLAKRLPGQAWLNDVSAVVLQQALADLNAAYRNYFASTTGKRVTVQDRARTPTLGLVGTIYSRGSRG
jgi:putative transposase